jgi:hypothetical protein
MRACRRHPREPAGWHCATCRADLCADCVTKQLGGPKGTQIAVCCTCGRGATLLTVHRRAAQRFARRLGRAFDFPLGTAGLIALAFVGFVRAFTSYLGAASLFGFLAFILRHGLYWAFVFFIIRSVASGQRRMGVFDFTDIQSDLVAPMVKGFFATAVLWVPAAIYVYLAADAGIMGVLTYPFYRDPTVWLLGLLGALYAPMALIAAATDLGFGHLLNPIFIFQAIYRMGRDYFVAVVIVGAVMLIGAGLAALIGAAVALIPIPFVGRWISFTVGLYPPFVAAAALGLLLHVHGEVFDWGCSEEYQVPLLFGVEPRGHLRTKPEPEPGPQPQPPAPRPAIAMPAPGPVSERAIEPLAPGPDMISLPSSLLNLSLPVSPPEAAAPAATPEPPPAPDPAPPAGDRPPSLLKYGIQLPSGILEAQAFVAPDEASAVDLPPSASIVQAAAAAAPPPAPPSAPAPLLGAGTPRTAIVEQRPGPLHISAAPTVHGFAVSLPSPSEAPQTLVGHEAVQPPAEPPDDAKPSGK